MNTTQSPSIRLILVFDILAQRFGCLSLFFGFPALGLIVFGILSQADHFFGLLGVIMAIVALGLVILLYWRIRIIHRIFSNGVVTRCTVVKAGGFGDETTLNGRYSYQGKNYSFSTVLQSTRRTSSLSRGDKIILMIDQDNPKRAFIRDLYLPGVVEDIRLSDTEKTPPTLMWPASSGNENEFIDNPSETQVVNLIHDVYMKKKDYVILELDVKMNLFMSIYDAGRDIRHCVGPDGPIYHVQDIPKETAIKVFLAYYSQDETWKTALPWKVYIKSIQAFEIDEKINREGGPPLDYGIP